MSSMLTPRLEKIMIAVVEYHIACGRPAGSKCLCSSGDFGVSASTIRAELARLEALGYLDHPHTSAGRVPTDKGYRYYVDHFFQEGRRRRQPAEPDVLGAEIEEALQRSASVLAESTGLLALVSAPSQDYVAIKHVEVLRLHENMVMVVAITASGGIAKKLFMFDAPVDPGLVDWAGGYLNECLRNVDLGSRRLRLHLEGARLSASESAFLLAIAPAFTTLPDNGLGSLYLDGVSGFFARLEQGHAEQIGHLMGLLDRQEEILRLLRSALMERRVYLLIGREMPAAAFRDLSLVAANYGLGHRNLGTVGVLGPTRMDYGNVINNVEGTARSLSRYVEEIYN